MKWVVVKKFPLSEDLSSITGFLHARRVEHHIYEESGEQILAVADAKLVAPIAQFLEDVAQGKFVITQEAAPAATQSAEPQMPSLEQQVALTPVAAVLIGLSMLGAVVVKLDIKWGFLHWLTFQDYNQFGFIGLGESLTTGQLWRFITPTFIHFGFFHVLFNCMWIWDLGRRLEVLMGSRSFSIFFLATAITANFAQYLWLSDIKFGGISGFVYACVGFIVVKQRINPHPLTTVSPVVLISSLMWLVFGMLGTLDTFIGGSVANGAHVGGLVAGIVFAFLVINPDKKNDDSNNEI